MKTKKIAFGGMLAALATVLMLIGYFPYLTYAVPCVASLAVMVAVLECGRLYGLLVYLASVLPVMIFCEPECKLVYTFVVGFYPILKALYEKLPNRVLEYGCKLLGFQVSLLAVYLLSTFVFGVTYSDLAGLGRAALIVFWLAANAVFLLYDRLLGQLAPLYFNRFHRTVSRMLKK